MAPRVCVTAPDTPSLPPLTLKPCGTVESRLAPTRRRHSGETFDRKSLQTYEVPELSARNTGVISSGGSTMSSFTRAIAGSFQFVIRPRNMSASRAPVNFSSRGTPGTL